MIKVDLNKNKDKSESEIEELRSIVVKNGHLYSGHYNEAEIIEFLDKNNWKYEIK